MSTPERSVSVIIPVYNCERYLGEAITSVLAQTEPAADVIVVDDGSTDGSAAVARAFGPPVRCLAEPHRGLSATLNRGIEEARGAFFAFLDADDLWMEDKLARQLPVLAADPTLDAVFGHVEQFVSPDLAPEERPHLPDDLRVAPGQLAGTFVIRAQAFHRVGPFDPHWQVGNFIEWYLRAQEAEVRDIMLPEIVLRRRLHANNMGTRERASRGSYAQILKQALDRRRRKGKIRLIERDVPPA